MKFKTILVAAVMFLGLSAAAFAQATFSVGSIPVTTVTNTGQTERTGDVTFTQISGTSQVGTITIAYGVPITVTLSTGTPVAVAGTGGYAGQVAVNATASNNSAGLLVININTGTATAGTIIVTGVRVAIAGTSLTTLQATISSVGNAIVAGQTTVTVISSTAAGIASVGTGTAAVAGIIQGVSGTVGPQPVITVTEGYLNAYKRQAADDVNSVVLRITLDRNPPAGVSVVFPATAGEATPGPLGWELCNSSGTSTTTTTITPTSTGLSAYYRIISGTPTTESTLIETVNIPITLTISSTATFPLQAAVVNYKVSLAPIGVAINSDGTFPTPLPRFAASDVGPSLLFTVVGSQTTLLIPLAQFVSFGTVNPVIYDTGISVANTTSDPGTTAMGGLTTAVKQAGTVTFYFFSQLATPTGTLPAMFTYTTKAGSPGTGLDSNGNVPSGSTYTVLLSQLLQASGAVGSFQGYIFVVANFTNAHSLYVLSNFANFSQGSLALVITSARGGGGEALNN